MQLWRSVLNDLRDIESIELLTMQTLLPIQFPRDKMWQPINPTKNQMSTNEPKNRQPQNSICYDINEHDFIVKE